MAINDTNRLWHQVSMKSDLGDRNNVSPLLRWVHHLRVSMKSGLGDRNNVYLDENEFVLELLSQ